MSSDTNPMVSVRWRRIALARRLVRYPTWRMASWMRSWVATGIPQFSGSFSTSETLL
ncbi:MAG: hypothetical protein OXG40_01620 [Acidimicrobiaceae bacterium]|nr:hypothetical protein [Acidimicrobiaceae bacterium]MDE0655708.1 hypothetical protein [Acidimicrobiaceae bacterium]